MMSTAAAWKQRIRRALKRLGLFEAARALYHYRRQCRYQHINRITLTFNGDDVPYSTEDFYSNYWFLPRCRQNRFHEPAVTRVLLHELRSTKCFADVGASIGYFTTMAARLIGRGHVYAFEIDETLAPIIRRNLEINGLDNVTLTVGAIAAEDDRVIDYRPLPYEALRRIYHLHDVWLPIRLCARSLRLDTFFADQPHCPDLFKIDIEGAELDALSGMSELIERSHPRMLIEVHPAQLRERGQGWKDVIDYLLHRGYELMKIDESDTSGARLLVQLDPHESLTCTTAILAK